MSVCLIIQRNVNNKFIERTGTIVSNALSVTFSNVQTGMFLTDVSNCLLKVQDHAHPDVSPAIANE